MEIAKRIRYRVVYSGNRIFYIVSTSNVERTEALLNLIGDTYTPQNGLASILIRSSETDSCTLTKKHYFHPNGNSESAALALIDSISNDLSAQPLFKQRY